MMTIFVATVFLVITVFCGFIINASEKPLTDSNTVIVLGCKVQNNQPSEMLRRRLDCALIYLNSNHNAAVIVTGGKGNEDRLSEAEVMKNYLVSKGIDENRIYVERQAKTTKENMMYSSAIMERNKLEKKVVLVTDYSHQFRASFFAKQYGIQCSPLSAHGNILFEIGYWLREIGSIVRAFLFNY